MKIVYYVASSLDGFIAGEDGDVSWLSQFDSGDYGYADFYESVDAVIMGRNTSEFLAELDEWPYEDKPAIICSASLEDVDDDSVAVTDKPVREIVSELRKEKIDLLWLVGGGQLAGSFLTEGLLDEVVVSLMPVVLGKGIPLFSCSDKKMMTSLKLRDSTQYKTGVVQLRYRLRT